MTLPLKLPFLADFPLPHLIPGGCPDLPPCPELNHRFPYGAPSHFLSNSRVVRAILAQCSKALLVRKLWNGKCMDIHVYTVCIYIYIYTAIYIYIYMYIYIIYIYTHTYIYISIYPYIYIYIWVNYNISLTWIKAIWGWFPLLTMIPVRSQWGRYNLPIYIYI